MHPEKLTLEGLIKAKRSRGLRLWFENLPQTRGIKHIIQTPNWGSRLLLFATWMTTNQLALEDFPQFPATSASTT